MATNLTEKSPLIYENIDEDDGLNGDLKKELDYDEENNSLRQQGNLVSIFSTWNMMMGTSLLTIPWALQQAGLMCGLVVMLFLFTVAVFTAVLLLKGAKTVDREEGTGLMPEFTQSCQKLLGKWTVYVNLGSTVILLGGALIVYWILMVDLAHNTVNAIYGAIYGLPSGLNQTMVSSVPSQNFSNTTLFSDQNKESTGLDIPPSALPPWTKQYLFPLIFIPIFLPILQLKEVTFFSRLTSLGTISLFVLFAFVLTKCFTWGVNVSFGSEQELSYVANYNPNFPALSGLASMAFFIHNSITTVYKHNKNQKQVIPCLVTGYFLTLASYLTVGVGIFICYPGKKSEIQQNFLNNIPWNDVFAIVVQVLFLFRMMTVFPTVSYILRVQIFTVSFNKDYPGAKINFIYSLGAIAPCVLCAIFYPNIGDILRYVGAICVVFIQFILPSLFYVVIRRRKSQTWQSFAIIGCIISVISIANLVAQFIITPSS